MKTNLNEFINSLGYLDVLFLYNHASSSNERTTVLDAIKAHLESDDFNKEFKYQKYNVHRKHISRFRVFAETTLHENSWFLIQEKLNFYAKRLINKAVTKRNSTLAEEILSFFERDRKFCETLDCFCLHNTIIVKFIVKNLCLQLQQINDFENQDRAIKLLEFYYPYFEQQESSFLFTTQMRFEFKDRKWERIENKIDELSKHYNSKYQDIMNKISLFSYFIPYNLIYKKKKEHVLVMSDLLKKVAGNPYYNPRLNALVNKLFFNDFIYLNDVHYAMRYYYDLKKYEVYADDTSNYSFHLEVALNLYDIEQVKKFMPAHNPLSMLKIDRFIVPYIVKYYLLTKKIEFAKFYMEYALRKLKKYDSILYFINTYSSYFLLMYKEREYDKIIETYENLSFRKKHIQSHRGGELNFEIRFYYLLAQYQLKRLNHEEICNKLCQLINPESENTNLFVKLKMKYNLENLKNTGFEIDNRLLKRLEVLKNDVKTIEEFIHQTNSPSNENKP